MFVHIRPVTSKFGGGGGGGGGKSTIILACTIIRYLRVHEED